MAVLAFVGSAGNVDPVDATVVGLLDELVVVAVVHDPGEPSVEDVGVGEALALLAREIIKRNADVTGFSKAVVNPRLRMNFDLRTSPDDGGQRMLNALMPGTVVPIHRHPMSNETVICLSGKLVEVIYEEDIAKDFPMGMDAQNVPSGKRFKESARYMLDPSLGNFGCVVPAGAWHTVEVFEPSLIFEAKDGKYGEDGSEAVER